MKIQVTRKTQRSVELLLHDHAIQTRVVLDFQEARTLNEELQAAVGKLYVPELPLADSAKDQARLLLTALQADEFADIDLVAALTPEPMDDRLIKQAWSNGFAYEVSSTSPLTNGNSLVFNRASHSTAWTWVRNLLILPMAGPEAAGWSWLNHLDDVETETALQVRLQGVCANVAGHKLAVFGALNERSNRWLGAVPLLPVYALRSREEPGLSWAVHDGWLYAYRPPTYVQKDATGRQVAHNRRVYAAFRVQYGGQL